MPELIVLFAVLLDLLLGEPPTPVHPTVWMGQFIGRFWKGCPSPKKYVEFLWGFLLVVSGLLLFSGSVFLITKILSGKAVLFLLVSIPLLKASFSIRYLIQSGLQIRDELAGGNVQKARELTSYHLVSRDTNLLSEGEICSCVIESLSENLTDSVSSPLFYFLILGLPGAWGYRFINTSDAMIAYRNEKYEWGGKFTAWCDTLLNWIPARITALMILVVTLFYPGVSFRNTLRTLISERKNTASPNAGWTMSAMAGALGVTLTKKGEYVLNGGEAVPDSRKIDICVRITVLSFLLIILAMIVFLKGGIWALNTVG